jgi:imidazolonepropionase-like amidohydrolase
MAMDREAMKGKAMQAIAGIGGGAAAAALDFKAGAKKLGPVNYGTAFGIAALAAGTWGVGGKTASGALFEAGEGALAFEAGQMVQRRMAAAGVKPWGVAGYGYVGAAAPALPAGQRASVVSPQDYQEALASLQAMGG